RARLAAEQGGDLAGGTPQAVAGGRLGSVCRLAGVGGRLVGPREEGILLRVARRRGAMAATGRTLRRCVAPRRAGVPAAAFARAAATVRRSLAATVTPAWQRHRQRLHVQLSRRELLEDREHPPVLVNHTRLRQATHP